jgi:hypothetical protein
MDPLILWQVSAPQGDRDEGSIGYSTKQRGCGLTHRTRARMMLKLLAAAVPGLAGYCRCAGSGEPATIRFAVMV